MTNIYQSNLLQVLNITQEAGKLLTEEERLNLVWRLTDEQIDEVLMNLIEAYGLSEEFEDEAKLEVGEYFYNDELFPDMLSIDTDEKCDEKETFEERMWARFTVLMN